MEQKASARGGARPGAGRRGNGYELVHRAFRLRKEDADSIKLISVVLGISQTEVIHKLLESFKQI